MVGRSRTRGVLGPRSVQRVTTTRRSDGTVDVSSNEFPSNEYTHKAYGKVETMNDQVTPDFRKVQAKGGIVNTQMSKYLDARDVVGGTGGFYGTTPSVVTTGVNTDDYTGDYLTRHYGVPTMLDVPAAQMANMKTAAATKALAGVDKPDVQGQVFMAELVKTLTMLRNPMQALFAFIEGWKKRNANRRYKGGAKFVPSAAGCWLELRYGWRPFLMEMEAILKSLRGGSVMGRKTSRGIATYNDRQFVVGTFITGSTEHDISHERTVEATVRSGILYDSEMDIVDQFGFSWSDIPMTAWELVPFSFVVDWFLKVGDFLGALTPRGGVVYLAKFESVAVKQQTVRTHLAMRHPNWSYQPKSGSFVRIVETYDRVPTVSTPGIAFAFSLSDALRGARVFDALGLLIQLLKR